MSLQTRLDALITAIGADIKDLQDGMTVSPLPSVWLSRNTSFTLTDYGPVAFTNKSNEVGATWTSGSSPYSYVIIPATGLYLCIAHVVWPITAASTGRRILMLTENLASPASMDAAGVLVAKQHAPPPPYSSVFPLQVVTLRYLNAGDQIRAITWASGTDSSTIDSGHLSISRIAGVKGDTGPAVISVPFTAAGPVATFTGNSRFYSPGAATVTLSRASLGTTGSTTTTVLIKKNGTTAVTLSLTSGLATVTSATPITLAANDYLTVDVSAAGTSAADLTVQLRVEE